MYSIHRILTTIEIRKVMVVMSTRADGPHRLQTSLFDQLFDGTRKTDYKRKNVTNQIALRGGIIFFSIPC